MRKAPGRETTAYARLMNLGSIRYQKDRPLFKATPSNLRMFSKTVYARRAINRIKGAIAMLDWEIGPKAGVDLNSELQRQIDVATMCFQRPNNDDSFRTLIEQAVEDYLVAGAGAIEQETGGDKSRPLWMWPVDSLSIQVFAGWQGGKDEARYFQTLGYGNVGGQQGIALTNEQLIYIRKDPTTENPFGYGCLEVAFASINRLLGVADYAGNLASNSQPENLLQFLQLDPTQLDRVREWWRNEIEGQGMTPILGGEEVKVHKLRGTDDSALYLKYQEMLQREIATAFELSPQNLGVEADVNRNTSEVADDRDWDGAIIPAATNFASHLTREAIEARLGFSQIEFRFLGLDRDDELNLAQVFETEYKNNASTPNEYRARKGMPPMDSDWADMPFADVEIAIKGAMGAKQVNPKLTSKE
ncbi:phage portal protein [Paraburkholderia sp. Tr-20389]|uniref:phage portal protein n=1 Tax=Paraburkholderia sp. Tr-20389 TaxID=2703903 RepID=UPI001F11B8D7|nr:phage portal protein [Paraburkholderia sp. Tr-20389]